MMSGAPSHRPRKSNLPAPFATHSTSTQPAPAPARAPLRTSGSIYEVRDQFARKPLFDGEVNRELDLMEKRSRSHVNVPAATGGTLVNSTALFGGNPFMERSRSSSPGASTPRPVGFVIPPPITRPFSVHQYLLSTDAPSSSSGRGRPSRSAAEAKAADDSVASQDRSGQSSGSRRRPTSASTPRRRHVRRHQVLEDEERGRAADAAMATTDPPGDSDTEAYTPASSEPPTRRPPGWQDLQADRDTGFNFSTLNGGFEWEKAKDENRVATQIERAALRSQLQQEKRFAQGRNGEASKTTGSLNEGVQTEPDPRWQAPFVPRATKYVREPSSAMPAAWLAAMAGERHPSNKTPPPTQAGMLLTPSTPFSVAQKPPETMDPIMDNPRWRDLVRSAPGTHTQHPTTEAMVTAATTALVAAPPESAAVEAGREAIRRITQRAASPLMERLDELQLANEELLVRNQALPPNALAGEAGYRARRTISRVAEANREPSDVPFALTPLGGYGSVVEAAQPSDDADFSPSRWQGAKLRNDAQHTTDSGSGHAELRRWAKDLTTTPHRSGPDPSRGIRTDSSAYNARKKWGSVSFASPLEQRGARGPLEELSNSARSLMQPPG